MSKKHLRTAVILCGGEGTRVKNIIGEYPKCLLKPRNSSLNILEFQINELKTKLFVDQITLLCGHYSDKISDFLKSSELLKEVSLIKETKQLGTGGAIKNYLKQAEAPENDLIIVNGDTIFNFSHDVKNADFDVDLIFGVQSKGNENDFGVMKVAKNGIILQFSEKPKRQLSTNNNFKYLINAGIYFFKSRTLNKFSSMPECFSLENDFWKHPKYVEELIHSSISIIFDVGTEQRLEAFSEAGYDILRKVVTTDLLIPARGGSKGIKENLQKVGGLSLVEIAIKTAKLANQLIAYGFQQIVLK